MSKYKNIIWLDLIYTGFIANNYIRKLLAIILKVHLILTR